MKSLSKIFFVLLLNLPVISLQSQDNQTVGLLTYDTSSYDGYTLFSPMTFTSSYLINNCGEKVHEWTFDGLPALSAYLQEDGTITRAERIPGAFGAGGTGGKIVKKSWDNELLWTFTYSDDTVRQHHDFQVLPNGNVMLLAWERKTVEEAVQAGRSAHLTTGEGVWFEHLVEIKPIGIDSGEIVWEWHIFDHLIQDRDDSKDNFGSVVDSPNKLNINYKAGNPFSPANPGPPDWLHMNSVQYHEGRDEIMLSARNTNEVYIIDHSTTTEEAASNEGGNSGKGGQLLFRWGNIEAYDKGTEDDVMLFAQHHAAWIDPKDPDNSSFTVFNNGVDRPIGAISSIEIVEPTMTDNEYTISEEGIYSIDSLRTILDTQGYGFTSTRLSGAQRLKNGNLLIASGNSGKIVEITSDLELVWEYVIPVNNQGPIEQGGLAANNDLFRSIRYDFDYPAFDGRTLEEMGTIELDTMPNECMLGDSIMSNTNSIISGNISYYPNPVNDVLIIERTEFEPTHLKLFDISGKQLKRIISLVVFNWIFHFLKTESILYNCNRTISFKLLKS